MVDTFALVILGNTAYHVLFAHTAETLFIQIQKADATLTD